MVEGIPISLKYRVVNRLTMVEVIHDLFHLHQSSWTVPAMQPGMGASSVLGSFTIKLPPPDSGDPFWSHISDYNKLDYFLRVEGYLGDVLAGPPAVAGFITGINQTSGTYDLTGYSDLWLASRMYTFPGEQIDTNNSKSPDMFTQYMTGNEVGFHDDMAAFTGTGYTSGNIAGLTAGTWTYSPLDGTPAASSSTGTGATLFSTATFDATQDVDTPCLVEMTGQMQLAVTGDATNSGEIGLVFGANASNCTLIKLRFRYNGITASPYTADLTVVKYVAGVVSIGPITQVAALTKFTAVTSGGIFPLVDVQIQAYVRAGGRIFVTINGNAINGGGASGDGAFDSMGPASFSAISVGGYYGLGTGASQAAITSLYGEKRYTFQTGVRTDSMWTAGTQNPGSVTGFRPAVQTGPVGPTTLDMWQRACELDGLAYLYTPQALVAGSRTLGKVDAAVASQIGTNLSTSVRFEGGLNLADVIKGPPAGGIGAQIKLNGSPYGGNGGQIIYRSVGAETLYGCISDNQVNMTSPDFGSLRSSAVSVNTNQASPASAITLVCVRDPSTADKWRERDTIYANWPERGINQQTYQIFAYDLIEGMTTQRVQVGQYGQAFANQGVLRMQRNLGAIQLLANTFKPR